MDLLFISGPYRADTVFGIKKNIDAAEATSLKYWKLGNIVYCPHKNTSYFDGEMPDEIWLRGNLEILKRCDGIVMMEGWENSEGAIAEFNIAVDIDLKIIYDGGKR